MEVKVSQHATTTGSKQKILRYIELLSNFQREAHDTIGKYASDRRNIRWRNTQSGYEVSEGAQAMDGHGLTQGRQVENPALVSRRQAVGDGLEPESGKRVERVGAFEIEQAVEVEVCENEGDVEASDVEELCEG